MPRRSYRWLYFVAKPLITVLIIMVAAFGGSSIAPAYKLYILAALLCCLVGDICLLFAGKRWFVSGLISFLAAHIMFIVAFTRGLGGLDLPWWAVCIVLYGIVFAARLLPHTGRLKLAVGVYCTVLIGVALAAAWRWNALRSTPALMTLGGALLFVVSDSLLAIRRFVTDYRFSHVAIMATYWSALVLIAASVAIAP